MIQAFYGIIQSAISTLDYFIAPMEICHQPKQMKKDVT